jgi:hypothetical protein
MVCSGKIAGRQACQWEMITTPGLFFMSFLRLSAPACGASTPDRPKISGDAHNYRGTYLLFGRF